MLSLSGYVARIRGYKVIEPPEVLAAIQRRITELPDQTVRAGATTALERVQSHLKALDLKDFGWPPQSRDPKGDVDMLHADSQKIVSAVLRIDHTAGAITVLMYSLKVRR